MLGNPVPTLINDRLWERRSDPVICGIGAVPPDAIGLKRLSAALQKHSMPLASFGIASDMEGQTDYAEGHLLICMVAQSRMGLIDF